DRLGMLYIANAGSDPDYQIKAINLYSDLSTQEPENTLWPQRLTSVATDINQLVEIFKKVWDNDRESTKKAWDYASICMRAEEYQKAIEPLEFLVGKSADVVNYWRQLATCYDKLEQYDKAVNAYLKLIELEPTNRDFYVNAAIEYKNSGQLSTARQYLYKASNISPDWDYPIYIEATLYEAAASRRCGDDFQNKLVYQLARDIYRKCANMGGDYSSHASQRAGQLGGACPTKEEYFFRNIKPGTSVSVSNACYGWIGKSVTSY
ncbi:MAG: tetratricopeptide repeat protein, partial [Ignavibacteriales bacterium]|nr:tetratricopeptide repeat protein [Ignavibacteriales bacterium]